MSGEINIDLNPLGKDEFLLCVGDNGIGISQDIKFEEIKTLGLLLINSLVKQLDGTISLDRSHGTLFKIKFKELKYKNRM
jgi:two-component sensor histidine kinase